MHAGACLIEHSQGQVPLVVGELARPQSPPCAGIAFFRGSQTRPSVVLGLTRRRGAGASFSCCGTVSGQGAGGDEELQHLQRDANHGGHVQGDQSISARDEEGVISGVLTTLNVERADEFAQLRQSHVSH